MFFTALTEGRDCLNKKTNAMNDLGSRRHCYKGKREGGKRLTVEKKIIFMCVIVCNELQMI